LSDWNRGRFFDGILVEGLNFAGKSTLTQELVRRLRARGERARAGHCWLLDEPLNREVHDRAFESVSRWEDAAFPDADYMRPFNVYRSAHLLMDTLIATRGTRTAHPAELLVQDRHWLTQYGSNEFFNPGEGLLSRQWIERCAPIFRLHVYVTCSPSVRRRRAESPDTRRHHGLHAYMRAHADRLGAFDELCRGLIGDDPSWIVCSTDDSTPAELATRVLAELDLRRGALPG
jgi:thymidylate kinase